MRRWLRWTLRCRRGRRCARLEISRWGVDFPPPPPGTVVEIDYTCGNCGTRYHLREPFLS